MDGIVALPVDRAIDVSGAAQAIANSCRLTHSISRPTAVCLHVNQRGLLKPKIYLQPQPIRLWIIALHLVRGRGSGRLSERIKLWEAIPPEWYWLAPDPPVGWPEDNAAKALLGTVKSTRVAHFVDAMLTTRGAWYYKQGIDSKPIAHSAL